ncbi:MAG: CoA transferase [Chloroflexi bacterium]|nr:CoA transferase [Chloroflexota bacterium]
MAALTGMRVLDMTQYEAGTSCTQYLAWLGADVVKIEGPNGDPGRSTGKGLDGNPGDPQYFMNYNGNKRSVVLDLKSDRGRQLLLDLVPHFDVFVENYGPGVIEALGITPDVLCAANPGLIYTRIKGFGLEGPYRDFKVYDWVAQAAAGTFSTTGDEDGPPQVISPTMGDSGTGMQAALGITAAYVEQQRTGLGQVIEVSMQEAVTMFMRTMDLPLWGKKPAPRHGPYRGRAGGGLYKSKGDGPNDYVFIYPATTRMLDSMFHIMDRDDLLSDPRFATTEERLKHMGLIREVIAEWALTRTKQEAMKILGSAGVPCSYVFDTLDLFTDEHLQARGFIREIDHPVNGTVRLMAQPLRMRGAVPQARSPLLGEHTAEVLAETLGLGRDEIARLEAEGVLGHVPA